MGQIVMREAPDVDYYCVWSSITESPVFTGNREETLAYISRGADEWLREDAPHHPLNRMRRTDELGTSSLWVEHSGLTDRYAEEGSWADDSYIYMQMGLLTRAGVFELCHRLDAAYAEDRALQDTDIADLLRPFDDDTDPIETPSQTTEKRA